MQSGLVLESHLDGVVGGRPTTLINNGHSPRVISPSRLAIAHEFKSQKKSHFVLEAAITAAATAGATLLSKTLGTM